jgi:hypothetical protein
MYVGVGVAARAKSWFPESPMKHVLAVMLEVSSNEKMLGSFQR